MEQTECSETSAHKLQTPGNYPKESKQHTEHGESLKSRKHIISVFFHFTKGSKQAVFIHGIDLMFFNGLLLWHFPAKDVNIVQSLENFLRQNAELYKITLITDICMWMIHWTAYSETCYSYLPACHAMVIEFLRLYASHEPSLNKTSSSWSGVILTEAWQWLPRHHVCWPSAFQLYLSQKTRDLHSIYRWAFGTRLNHKLQVVVREMFQKTTRNASPVVNILNTLFLQNVIIHNTLRWRFSFETHVYFWIYRF